MDVYLDYETASECDLLRCGLHRYVAHPSTHLLMMAWAIDDGPVEVWMPGQDRPFIFTDRTITSAARYHAHNAEFERLVTRHCFPWSIDLPPERWACTAAQAACAGYPRSLEAAAIASGIVERKDPRGSELIRKLCKPKVGKNGEKYFNRDPELMHEMTEYCRQDVITERALSQALPPMSAREREIWCLDQRINDRGIPIDIELVQRILSTFARIESRSLEELRTITQGRITSGSQIDRILQWIRSRDMRIDDLTAGSVASVIASCPDPDAVRVCRCRQQLSRAAAKKFLAFRDRVDESGLLRGTLVYHGTHTGRWSGRGAQVQNFPRGTLRSIEEIDLAREIVMGDDPLSELDMLFDDPAGALTSLVRSCIVSRNDRLGIVDYAQIEARALASLAGQHDLIADFKAGVDVYSKFASYLYGYPCGKDTPRERWLGKTAILGLGYGMGAPKFRAVCDAQGVSITEEFAEKCVASYRQKYDKIVAYWYSTEKDAVSAVLGGCEHGMFAMDGTTLTCQLPSGRLLRWHRASVSEEKAVSRKGHPYTRRRLRYHTVDRDTGAFNVIDSHGGLLTENIVQASCRDIPASAMLELERRGYDTILHVHDEIVCDLKSDQTIDGMRRVIEGAIDRWAVDIPIKTEGFEAARYGKG